jgi:hypothetical protein
MWKTTYFVLLGACACLGIAMASRLAANCPGFGQGSPSSLCDDTDEYCAEIPECFGPAQCNYCSGADTGLMHKVCHGADNHNCTYWAGCTGANGCGNVQNRYCVDAGIDPEVPDWQCQGNGGTTETQCLRNFCKSSPP